MRRTANGILLQFSRLAMHHDDRRRVRLHLDGGRELRQLRAAAAAAAGNRRVLRCRWLLLRDDAGRLLRYVVERRRLYAEYLRTANRFLLRALYKRMLRFHRINVRDYFGNVDEWRRLPA